MILYAVTQVTRQLIQPKMVSDSIGIDTLTTLVFMFIGWRAAGLIGMIVAVPVGLIILKLSEAGAFDHILKSIKELREEDKITFRVHSQNCICGCTLKVYKSSFMIVA